MIADIKEQRSMKELEELAKALGQSIKENWSRNSSTRKITHDSWFVAEGIMYLYRS